MKKALRETQTLRAGCSKAELKNFAPPQDGQNVISCRWSLPLPTNPVWWGSMYAISSYRGNRPTYTQTHPQTHALTDRTDYNTLRRSQLARSVTTMHRYFPQFSHVTFGLRPRSNVWTPRCNESYYRPLHQYVFVSCYIAN